MANLVTQRFSRASLAALDENAVLQLATEKLVDAKKQILVCFPRAIIVKLLDSVSDGLDTSPSDPILDAQFDLLNTVLEEIPEQTPER